MHINCGFKNGLVVLGLMVVIMWLPYTYFAIANGTGAVEEATCTIQVDGTDPVKFFTLRHEHHSKLFCLVSGQEPIGEHCGLYTNNQQVPCYITPSSKPFFTKHEAQCAISGHCELICLLFIIASYATAGYAGLTLLTMIYQLFSERTLQPTSYPAPDYVAAERESYPSNDMPYPVPYSASDHIASYLSPHQPPSEYIISEQQKLLHEYAIAEQV